MKKKLKRIHYSLIPLGLAVGFLFGVTILSHMRFFLLSVKLSALIFFFCLVNSFAFKKFGRVIFSGLAGLLLAVLRFNSIAVSNGFLESNRNRTFNIEAVVATDVTNKNKT